jgi:hypothetical protein
MRGTRQHTAYQSGDAAAALSIAHAARAFNRLAQRRRRNCEFHDELPRDGDISPLIPVYLVKSKHKSRP